MGTQASAWCSNGGQTSRAHERSEQKLKVDASWNYTVLFLHTYCFLEGPTTYVPVLACEETRVWHFVQTEISEHEAT